jgi:hypothetical protein
VFENPPFHTWSVIYTALGVILFWSKWGREKVKAYYLSELVETFVKNERAQMVIELLLFVSIGCLVGIGIVRPQNIPQALSAGLGWTGLVAHHRSGVK